VELEATWDGWTEAVVTTGPIGAHRRDIREYELQHPLEA
jgi:hypothetical protein